MLRASEVRAAREPEPKPPPGPVDLGGASTGRALERDDAPAPASPPEPDDDDGLSPFQRFAPRAAQLSGTAEARSGESLQVIAIVGGLLFMISAAAVVSLLVVVVGWLTVGDMIEDGALGLTDAPEHIGDTDVAEEIVKKTPAPTGKGKAGASGGADDGAGEPAAPTTGSGTIILGEDVLFHSMEVNCASSSIRTRANFRGGRATAHGLPLDEDCVVTFQGSEPARAFLRGGQTKRCTFNPTRCLMQ